MTTKDTNKCPTCGGLPGIYPNNECPSCYAKAQLDKPDTKDTFASEARLASLHQPTKDKAE